MNACKIIITRPKEQLEPAIHALQASLRASGLDHQVFGLPLLEIVPFQSPELAKDLHDQLVRADWLSFVSPNAFLMADQLLKSHQYDWPTHLKLALVGGGTEQAILHSRLHPVVTIKPSSEGQWDSEGLWQAMSSYETNWEGKRFLIIKGDTGREWLENTLQAQQAEVHTIGLYQRKNLALTDPYWQDFLQMWQALPQDVIPNRPRLLWLMSSSLSCQYLEESLTRLGLKEVVLKESVAFATHEKIANTAQRVGFAKVEKILPGQHSIEKNITDWITKTV